MRLKYYYQNYHHSSVEKSLEEMLMQFKEDDTNSTLLPDFIELIIGYENESIYINKARKTFGS